MRTVKIALAALLLLAVGFTTGRVGRVPHTGASFLASGTASATGADSLPSFGAGGFISGGMSEGSRLLNEKCSTCHSVNFVLKSGLLAGEADSVITCMESKNRSLLIGEEHELIRLYLQSRLPIR